MTIGRNDCTAGLKLFVDVIGTVERLRHIMDGMTRPDPEFLRAKAREMAAYERRFWARMAELGVSDDHARLCLDHALHEIALGVEENLDPYGRVAEKLASDPSWRPSW